MDIKQIKISEIVPYAKNAKKHSKKQIEQVATSIKSFGFRQPVVLDESNVIIVGHGRVEAAKLLGLDVVPSVVVEDLSQAQIKAYRLADNKLNESDWDMDLVVEELKELEADMVDLTGFSLDLLVEANEKDDQVPELPEEPKSKLGELYQLGRHRLMCGDSTKLEDVEKLMDGQKADLLVTDPPYNLAYDFGKNGMVQTGQRKSRFGQIKNDEMSDEDFKVFLSDCFTNAYVSLKAGGSYYVFGGRESTINFNLALEEKGFYIAQWVIWKKENFNISRLSFHPSHEIISYGWKKEAAHAWYGGRSQRDVLDVSRERSPDHPTQKPVELLSKLVINSSKEGDLILDLFGGSGSTLITCEKVNRNCVTMEYDPKYVDVIIKRWEEYTGKKATLIN